MEAAKEIEYKLNIAVLRKQTIELQAQLLNNMFAEVSKEIDGLQAEFNALKAEQPVGE